MTFSHLIATWLMPPGIVIILLLCALLITKKVLSRIILMLAVIILYGLSTPFVTNKLNQYLNAYPTLNLDAKTNAQAIVVLTAGIRYADEFKAFVSSNNGLARARYAAMLYEKTKLPILISGGNGNTKLPNVAIDAVPSEAAVMAKIMTKLGVPIAFLEENSRNTYENANNSQVLLKEKKIKHIILVTNALHMKRSALEFERRGIQVSAAPTLKPERLFYNDWRDFMPSTLSKSNAALHELLGLIWYQFKHWYDE